MNGLIRFIQTLDYMRIVLGICIVVDGYPLFFFFRETLRLAPGSTCLLYTSRRLWPVVW